MDFFKSVFSNEPDPPRSDPESSRIENQTASDSSDSDPASPQHGSNPNTNSDSEPEAESETTSAWSFGGLIRNLTIKSESVIETYRRDLQEFGTGLKKEIEVAQGSLGTVSHAIDEIGSTVIKGTSQIISHGKEVILAADQESDSSGSSQSQSFNSKRYSRFDAQVCAIQSDVGTYCDEPEDLSDYMKWKLGFDLNEKREEIEGLFEENGAMESVYNRIVPSSVDHETFWCRYFYKIHKLKQAEDLRVKLVNRAISTEEEELSWDVDDSDDEEEKNSKKNLVSKVDSETGKEAMRDSIVEDEKSRVGSGNVEGINVGLRGDSLENEESVGNTDEKSWVDSENVVGSNVGSGGDSLENKESGGNIVKDENSRVDSENVERTNVVSRGESGGSGSNQLADKDSVRKVVDDEKEHSEKPDEKVVAGLEAKSDHGRESSKGSDYSVVSTQPSLPEEEDLGWDEIEDLSSIDDNKRISQSGSPNRADLRKRLIVAEEEEDLSWDIEDDDDDDDDDEPVKA